MLTRRVTEAVLLRIQQHKEQVDGGGGAATTLATRAGRLEQRRLEQGAVAWMEAEYTMLLPVSQTIKSTHLTAGGLPLLRPLTSAPIGSCPGHMTLKSF